jgi:hypothetical protein
VPVATIDQVLLLRTPTLLANTDTAHMTPYLAAELMHCFTYFNFATTLGQNSFTFQYEPPAPDSEIAVQAANDPTLAVRRKKSLSRQCQNS